MSTRKSFTIQEKVEVIKLLEAGESNRSVARKFKMSPSTISTIWKGRNTVKQVYEDSPAAKRLRPCNEVSIDEALLKWLKIQTSQNIKVSTTTLQEKAKEFALDIGQADFQCTVGWIQRFRKRYENICGRKRKVSNVFEELSVNWLSTVWPDLRRNYLDDEIYNAVEQSCLFGFSSNRTFVSSHETCPQIRRDFSKERLTIFIAANMTGSEKLKPVVIGKSNENDQCFENINSLPVDYEHHPKGSLNSNLFEKIINNWDNSFYQQKKKILLLVDKCSTHLMIDNLKAIELVFLPTNIKSPLKTSKKSSESSVITSLKNEFRSLEIKKLLEDLDSSSKPMQITIAEACVMISRVWDEISQCTISNSFNNSGFNVNIKLEESSDDVLPLEVCVEENLTAEYNVVVKEEVCVTENQITEVNSIKIKDENSDVDSAFVPPTIEEASFAIRTVRDYFMFNQAFIDDKTKTAVSHLEYLIQAKLLKKA